ncbi:MAG: adenylate/guanylate cyclase domain-containing protein [Acidimicrobiia bacterium]
MAGQGQTEAMIAELLDRALDAANRGDMVTVHRLAGEVLAEDATNADAEELMASELSGSGELRRASIMFCDLVGSTELSGRHEPELYRGLVRRYKEQCRSIIEERYDGHVVGAKGDGILALFGIPRAHGNDVERAVRAGLDVVDAVHELSTTTQREFGEPLDVRVAVHRGVVYLDTEEDDVYGHAVNVAARLETLAEAGTVVVSEEVRALADSVFVLEAQPAQAVKGVTEPLQSYRVDGERPVAVARPLRSGSQFVGRAEELDRLVTMWHDVCGGAVERPIAVMLRGEAGIGKTRLAAAVAEIARVDGATVVELTGSSFHVETGFHSLRSLIERRVGLATHADGAERLTLIRQELVDLGLDDEQLVPLLAPVLGVQPAAGYVAAASDARKLHEDVSKAAEEYLTACLAPGPSVLIADDLQWLDESTRTLLSRIAARAPTPLLVIMTARPVESPPSAVDVFDIGPLSAADSQALLDALGTRALADDERAALIERGDGVPLYLEELARAARGRREPEAASGEIADAGMSHARAASVDGGVPDLLYELLVALLYARPDVAPVAAAAATIGRDIDHALLAEVLDLSEAELEPAIETLLEERVLEQDTANRSHFRHELLREVAYELQPPSQQRQLHARVGDALVRRHEGNDVVDWALVANHFERARKRAAAADAYEQSADEARRRGALDEARSNLGKAIESIEGLPAGGARDRREVELRLRRGFLAASMEGNASTSAVADYGRCLSLAGLDAGEEPMFRTLIVLFGYFGSRGEIERAHQVLTILRSVLTGDREFWLPFNTAGFGMLDWFAGNFAHAQEQLELAGAAAYLVGRDDEVESSWLNPMDPKVSIHMHLSLGRFVRGDRAGSDDQLDEAVRRASSLAFPQGPFSMAYVLAFNVWMRLESGELDTAAEAVEQLTSLAGRHGFDSWMLVAVTQETMVNALRARDAAAPDPAALTTHAGMIEGLIAAWSQFDIKAMLPFYGTMLGTVVAAAGNATAARSHFESSLELAKSTGMHFYDSETLRYEAALETTPGQVVSGLRDALRTAREQGAHLFELRAALDLFRLEPSSNAADLEAAISHFPPGAQYPELDLARAALSSGG